MSSSLENVCRQLAGSASLDSRDFHLAPGAYVTAIDLLDEVGVDLTVRAITILERWAWFRRLPDPPEAPWLVTEHDWRRLTELAPWGEDHDTPNSPPSGVQLEIFPDQEIEEVA